MFIAKAFGTRIIPYNKLLEVPFMGEDLLFTWEVFGWRKIGSMCKTHTIHGTYHPWDWHIYLHVVDFYGKCR